MGVLEIRKVVEARGRPGASATPYRATCTTVLLFLVTLFGLIASLNRLLPSCPACHNEAASHAKSAQPQPLSVDNGDIYPDTDYPLRPAEEQWDISSSFSYPRVLSKTVTEGTWLRIAVNPILDEIVFDMLGDLYCMSSRITERGAEKIPRKARAFLRGIPFDKEAEFSADGRQIVFISDAGFGVDNVWTLPYTSCADMASRAESGHDLRTSAIQQTNSTFRFFSSPAFHPSEPKILATKWFLTGRPNGAGEIWEIPMRNIRSSSPLPERDGRRVVARRLPASWPASRYFESQLGAEQARYHPDSHAIIYATNANGNDAATGKFSYNKDIHAGINAVHILNTSTDTTTVLVAAAASAPNQPASPGGASMPRLSPDGRTLAFVRRVDDKSVLVLKDMRSGTVHHAWDGLVYDLSMIPAFMGAYPNFGFRGDGSGIIIWSSGHIWNVPLKFNHLGERVVESSPQRLDFEAEISLQLANTRHGNVDISPTELASHVRVRSLSGLRSSFDGQKVVLEAAGDNYLFDLVAPGSTDEQEGRRISKPSEKTSCYSPSFVPNTDLFIQACWDDVNLTTLYLANAVAEGDTTRRQVVEIFGVPPGRYISPVVGSSGLIAIVRTGADYMTGDMRETLGGGIWIGQLDLSSISSSASQVVVKDLHRIEGLSSHQETKLDFVVDRYLLIQNPDSVAAYNLATGKQEVVATGKTSVEMTASIMGHGGGAGLPSCIAFRDFQHAWLAPDGGRAGLSSMYGIWSKPGDLHTPRGIVRLSKEGGHDVTFSSDGKRVFWLFGPTLYYADVKAVTSSCQAVSQTARDSGLCAQGAVSSLGLNITSRSVLGILREESSDAPLVLVNASLISMSPTLPQVLSNATIVIQHGKITAAGPGWAIPLPTDTENAAAVFDLAGGAVLPGFIDFHGHWGGFLSRYPVTSWEMSLFLAYGVTTIHNPASRNVAGMTERLRIEKGQMWGPRVFHTGDVLYGSTQPSVYTEINSLDDARAALERIRVEGGESTFTVKNYQLVPRSARQRLLHQADHLGMLVMPEGGWSLDWDLTYLIDGYTTLEHSLPIPSLYDDVLSLVAASGSSYTPLAVMNYGGIFGQHWIHQSVHLPADPKLRKFLPHAILESLTEVKQAPQSSYQFFNTTMSTGMLKDRGVRTNVGAHGEQPIGYLYHAEMDMMKMGGQSAYEVLKSATRSNAESLGLGASLGSVEVGKLADLVVYPAGVADVSSVWARKKDMKWTISRGRILSISAEEGLVEVWPVKGRRQVLGRMNAEEED